MDLEGEILNELKANISLSCGAVDCHTWQCCVTLGFLSVLLKFLCWNASMYFSGKIILFWFLTDITLF